MCHAWLAPTSELLSPAHTASQEAEEGGWGNGKRRGKREEARGEGGGREREEARGEGGGGGNRGQRHSETAISIPISLMSVSQCCSS